MNLDEDDDDDDDDDEEETTAAHTDIVTMFLVDNESQDLNPTGPLYVVTISHYLLSLRGEYTHHDYITFNHYFLYQPSLRIKQKKDLKIYMVIISPFSVIFKLRKLKIKNSSLRTADSMALIRKYSSPLSLHNKTNTAADKDLSLSAS